MGKEPKFMLVIEWENRQTPNIGRGENSFKMDEDHIGNSFDTLLSGNFTPTFYTLLNRFTFR
jgi:hypothetical protein